MFFQADGITSLAILCVGVLFCLQIRQTNQANEVLRHQNSVLRQHIVQLKNHIHHLSGAHTRSQPSLPKEPVSDTYWQVMWAREVLGLHDPHLTAEKIRSARTRAIKARHPDAGGSQQQLADLERAVNVLHAHPHKKL